MNHQSSFSLRSFFQPVDLTQGTCWKTLLVFAFPIIVSYLLQQVYSISDAAIVGQTLTASEVAGVNDTTSLAMIFLQFAFGVSAGFWKLLRENHYEIGNIDATIIAQKPKMAPHIPQMRANMAKAMGINESQLNIKATTEEKLGFTGREEGIASQAICLLNERKES